MLRATLRKCAALTAADLFALNQRSRFASYTQYDDAQALQRSYQCASPAVRLTYEERAAAISDELGRASTVEETFLSAADGDVEE
ncbi:unspecified product [Leptomonas pyrrhocoris]|uniref:Unspecified product n=1 Tax=Leptomonas pyrrhocoris TaxID=157538 RepID=A0A0M9FWY3_LEPPY|nr:unspecified product [Leptomonas pyrrhocoris]XP_015656205.1 unspecified product [Leptomonas pyrrhocoris]KPA77765.1 unspecified product [Leptomonas pyrrhocoris]KPA77766.1 unspecified product [Leptomonas pyrrhocoris]|eukprot:XP_015656204.1 unspecified product [Leptomonas pyrrhocoris]